MENKSLSALRILIDLREVVQRQRIAFGNRLAAIERGDDTVDNRTLAILSDWHDFFLSAEKRIDGEIKSLAEEIEIIRIAQSVKGVGPILIAKVVALIRDISKSPTVSSLWRFAGYAVVDGHREYPQKGKRRPYSLRLKSAAFVLAQSLIRRPGPYRNEYDKAKEHYQATHPEWTRGHIHLAAMRKVTKLFLAHLWEIWRKLEGLPTREVYVVEKLGHTHIKRPVDYGWPEI